jgi:predicted RNA-binding protein with RPS1 domain
LVEGKITRLTKFGAFAKLENDLEGLIHISELSEKHIDHPKEALHEGDIVTLRIIKIEPESHRIGLSLRRVESQQYTDLDMKILQKELESGGTTESAPEEEKSEPKKKTRKKPEAADSKPETTVPSNSDSKPETTVPSNNENPDESAEKKPE